MRLKGKVAVVTGASRGIGAAVAARYAREGADVALCARTREALDAAAEEVRRHGRRALAGAVDVRDVPAVEAFAEGVREAFGRVDVLVNNAAILGPRVPLVEIPLDAWREVVDVNVHGTLHVVRAFVPAMIARGAGSVVTVTSGVGNVGRPNWGAYGVSKFAQEGLAYGLAAELEGTGVRSNLVDPGAVRTEMRATAYPREDPNTLRTPDEVAEVFVYLASDESRRVNGRRLEAWHWADGRPPDPVTGA